MNYKDIEEWIDCNGTSNLKDSAGGRYYHYDNMVHLINKLIKQINPPSTNTCNHSYKHKVTDIEAWKCNDCDTINIKITTKT